MQKLFKIVAYSEGISFLLLLVVAMPLKYIYGEPLAVRIVGMAHGILFLAYLVFIAKLSTEELWPRRKIIEGIFSSILPFGPFFFHPPIFEKDAP